MLSSVRAEIKAWERNFKDEHGTHPSVQDIKQQPEIAEKYKLYKKLSKAAAPQPETLPNDPPSTPLRKQKRDPRHASLLLSKPRVVDSGGPLSIYNPFSPVKSKGKSRDTSSRPNLFATPSKGKRVDTPEGSPDPDTLPAIIPFQPVASTSQSLLAPAENAVSRARKRLRGEPVSPSPNKEKRRRIGGTQISLPFAKLGGQPSDDENSDLDDNAEANSSFVDDSPVKAPVGNRSFKLLFEEALPSKNAKPKGLLSRSKTKSVSTGLFGDRILSKEDKDQDSGPNALRGAKGRNNELNTKILSSGKDDLFSGNASEAVKPGIGLTRRPSATEAISRTSTKRSLEDADEEDAAGGSQVPVAAAPVLIPPHTNPSSRASNLKGKGKATAASRKKAKLLEELGGDDEDSPEEEMQIKLVGRNGPRRRPHNPGEDDADFGFHFDEDDPILGYAAHRASRATPFGSTIITQDDVLSLNHGDDSGDRDGKFEVDLPDKLKRVLNISPSKNRESREERVVRGLLSGRRAEHYDPAKGGEIWDVGEHDELVGEGHGEDEGEEDWQGEPVPWEVGEL